MGLIPFANEWLINRRHFGEMLQGPLDGLTRRRYFKSGASQFEQRLIQRINGFLALGHNEFFFVRVHSPCPFTGVAGLRSLYFQLPYCEFNRFLESLRNYAEQNMNLAEQQDPHNFQALVPTRRSIVLKPAKRVTTAREMAQNED